MSCQTFCDGPTSTRPCPLRNNYDCQLRDLSVAMLRRGIVQQKPGPNCAKTQTTKSLQQMVPVLVLAVCGQLVLAEVQLWRLKLGGNC